MQDFLSLREFRIYVFLQLSGKSVLWLLLYVCNRCRKQVCSWRCIIYYCRVSLLLHACFIIHFSLHNYVYMVCFLSFLYINVNFHFFSLTYIDNFNKACNLIFSYTYLNNVNVVMCKYEQFLQKSQKEDGCLCPGYFTTKHTDRRATHWKENAYNKTSNQWKRKFGAMAEILVLSKDALHSVINGIFIFLCYSLKNNNYR